MAFIPGETGGVLVGITSGTGSGILSSTNFGGIASLSAALVAGTNVAISPDPAFGGKGLRIDATPGTAGVNSLTVGTGISNTGTAIDPIINNTGVLSVSTTGSGSGITISGTAANPQIANAGVLSVSTSGSGSGITIGGTAANPQISNAGVLSVNSNQGQITLASAGGSVTITNPTPGTINLEAPTGGGTLTGITAGAGISVTPTNPAQPTVTNTGVTSLTAGNNMLVSAPTGSVILAAKVARPMAFSVGALSNFPIANNNFGNFSCNTLTTFGDLLAGTGDFIGVNTGTVIMDMAGFGLTTVTGQAGTYQVYVNVVGQPGTGLLVNTIAPSYPIGSTQDASFNLGSLVFTMEDFRAAFGTGGANASIYVAILNNNVNTIYPAGNALNYMAYYWPDSTN